MILWLFGMRVARATAWLHACAHTWIARMGTGQVRKELRQLTVQLKVVAADVQDGATPMTMAEDLALAASTAAHLLILLGEHE